MFSLRHIWPSLVLLLLTPRLTLSSVDSIWCATMLLVTIYRAPALEPVHNPGTPAAILKSHAMLSTWAANPGVASIVRRLEEEMIRKGLQTTQESTKRQRR
jgi:hypothetical protein